MATHLLVRVAFAAACAVSVTGCGRGRGSLAPPPTTSWFEATVDAQARDSAPGARRSGELLRGATERESHGDWNLSLEAGHCYSFSGAGDEGVRALQLYLWDPSDHRVAREKTRAPRAVLTFCATAPGTYHLQAKVSSGAGHYAVGIYAKPPATVRATPVESFATSGFRTGKHPSNADKDRARGLLDDGDALFDAGDFEGALRNYETAHAIMGVPTTGAEVARAEEALGKLVEAREMLLEVSRYPSSPGEPGAFTRARAEAGAGAARLASRIPTLRIAVSGPPPGAPVVVAIDGAPVPDAAATAPHKLNPGTHTVTASTPGYMESRGEATLRAGQASELKLQLRRE